MTANTYDKGDLVRLTGTFTVSTTPTDPTTVTLSVKDPSGNVAIYTYALAAITKSATGVYYKNISLDEAGYWYYQWVGTGTVVSADEEYFVVRSRQVGT